MEIYVAINGLAVCRELYELRLQMLYEDLVECEMTWTQADWCFEFVPMMEAELAEEIEHSMLKQIADEIIGGR